MYIFSQTYRKQVKQKLVNTLYNYYKQYNNNRYSDELVGFFIKATHMYHPITCLFVMWNANYTISMFTFLSILCVFFMFIYLNGCFLSALEYKINKQDITIADPIIMLCNDTINYKNRVAYSIVTIGTYLLFCVALLLYRFYPFSQLEL